MALKFAIVPVILSIVHWSNCSNGQQRRVCIVPGDSHLLWNTNPALGSPCEANVPVMSITKFCQESGQVNSNTIATILEGTHRLKSKCEFNSVTGLELGSHSESKVVINCSPFGNVGLYFLNVSSLTIFGIQLSGCGSVYNQLFDGLTHLVIAAILLVDGSNVHLRNVSVLNSKSAGIYVYNVAGNVTLDFCTVTNASSNELEAMSGTVVVYDNSTTCSTNFHISNCYFSRSGYTNSCNFIESYSSGLSLFINNTNTTFLITDTKLLGNSGCNGGNMVLLIFDCQSKDRQRATVQITNTDFTYGEAYIGGGLYISYKGSFSFRKHVAAEISHAVSIIGSRFIKNFAGKNGGGIYIQWKQSLILDQIVDMNIMDSTFDGNSIGEDGSGGLALHYKIYLDTGDEPHRLPKFRVNLNILNCSFHNHSPNLSSNQLLSESSVILAKSAPYLGLDSITVSSNKCTGILALGSTLVFSGSSKISDNTALTGGGIRLCSSALVYLTPHTDLEITNNSVKQAGGGILVNSNCLVNIPMCFYQYSSAVARNHSLLNTINVSIFNNSAPKGGDNIYGGSIDYCYFLYIRRDDSKFKNQLQVPPNTLEISSSISSNPQQVCFEDRILDSESLACAKEIQVSIYPGQNQTISLRVAGQVNGSVSGTVLASFVGEEGSIKYSEQVQTVSISGGNLTYTIYSTQYEIVSNKDVHLNLEVDVVSDRNVNEYIRRYPPAVVIINFKKCPFGFRIASISTTSVLKFSCECVSKSSPWPVEDCSIDEQTIKKRTKSWVGVFSIDKQDHLATSDNCPLDYCVPDVYIKSSIHSLDQDHQCRYNRTGVLCGSCPKDWSLILGTSECCEKCSNAWLLLIIPFTLVGLLLVVVIHFLNMTVTMGTINGLIFYANIIQDYSVVVFHDHPVPVLTPVLRVFIAWFNLDLGIATCFYDGMEAFGKNFLLGLFPIYIWLISIIIIVLSNRYISITRLVGNNAVKVLATLFLLSYSKMLRVTIGTLNAKILNIHIDSTTTVSKLRWILDGNIAYFDPHKHLGLFVISMVFIILSLPFTISLLCIKHVFSLSTCCRAFAWIDKLKPFFDTYTGPFKDNARFWTGLLLLIRLIFLLVHIFDYKESNTPYYIILLACLVLCVLMVVLNGVYKKHHLNILESFFIFNISLVFLSHVGVKGRWRAIASHTFVGIALLVFLGIIAYHVYLKFPNCNLLRRLPAFWRRRAENFDVRCFEGMRGFEEADHETSEDEDMVASDRLVHFPPLENISYDYECSRSFSSKAGSRRS